MNHPKFEKDLCRAYDGDITLNELIQQNEKSIQQISKHAVRYKTDWMLSDEDDVFQEACCWLVQAMWDWDETKGTSLYRYVVYNIGVRLASQIKSEKAQYRHPSTTSKKCDIWDTINYNYSHDQRSQRTFESYLPSTAATPETISAIHEALELADNELTALALELTIAMFEESGNFAAAVRKLGEKNHIKKRFGPDHLHLRYALKTKVLPEIFQFFNATDIIPL